MSKIELWQNSQERRKFEELADLYALLRTTEALEIAYTRDAIDSYEEYAEQCQKLINQFRATEKALIQNGTIQNLEQFLGQFQVVDCPRALERMRVGGPQANFNSSATSTTPPYTSGGSGPAATSGNNSGNSKSAIQVVKELTELFIYCSNLISLNHRAVDELAPQLEALVKTIERAKVLLNAPAVVAAAGDNNEVSALQNWVKTLQLMRASDEIDEEQARQLQFDLNTAKTAMDEMLL